MPCAAPVGGRSRTAGTAPCERSPPGAGTSWADLSKGSLGADGGLVCPWHGSRYDLDSGAMVSGPKGFLWYVGRTPGYTQAVKAFGLLAVLRRRRVVRDGDQIVVQE